MDFVPTSYITPRPGGPLKVNMKVADRLVAEGTVPVSAPLAFTANDCLNIGITLGSPVSFDYREKAPFKFNGMIERVHVRYATATRKIIPSSVHPRLLCGTALPSLHLRLVQTGPTRIEGTRVSASA